MTRGLPPHPEPPLEEPDRRRPELASEVRRTLTSVASALGWVALGLASLASWVLALWVTLALARVAQGDMVHALGTWLVALAVTIGAPFLLAVWKHSGDARGIRTTMTWLPVVWNVTALALASQLIPDIVGTALRRQGAWVLADKLGHSHSSTRVLSALGHKTADVVDPDRPSPPLSTSQSLDPLTPPAVLPKEVDRKRAITVPFREEGTAIMMDTTLIGPAGSVDLPYLFDTGASFTTISSDTAAELGLEIPADAPTLNFNTASGPRESQVVYLPTLRLSDVEIPGLLVSVCDTCVNERTHGLLGLNVVREFFVEMDYKNQRMTLLPRIQEGPSNRAYDIEPMVHTRIEGSPEVWLGRVHWVVLVENHSPKTIKNVVPWVRFDHGPDLTGAPIESIAPGETGRSLVEGQSGLSGKGRSDGRFTLTLREAYW